MSSRTQSVRDNAIDGWCRETEDPASVCLSATTTRTWRWNILGQVWLILGPRLCHLGGCRIDLAETVNGLEWTGSDRHTDRPSELIYKIVFGMVHGQSYERVQKISSILIPIIHHWNYMDTFYYVLNRSIHKNET